MGAIPLNGSHPSAVSSEKRRASQAAWFKRWYHSDPSFRQKRLDKHKQYRHTAAGKQKKKDYYLKNRPRIDKHRKALRIKQLYGLTVPQRDALFAANNGMCWLCSSRISEVVDHCHATGIVRGALCRPCNAALGLMGDNVESVTRALEYLNGTPDLAL